MKKVLSILLPVVFWMLVTGSVWGCAKTGFVALTAAAIDTVYFVDQGSDTMQVASFIAIADINNLGTITIRRGEKTSGNRYVINFIDDANMVVLYPGDVFNSDEAWIDCFYYSKDVTADKLTYAASSCVGAFRSYKHPEEDIWHYTQGWDSLDMTTELDTIRIPPNGWGTNTNAGYMFGRFITYGVTDPNASINFFTVLDGRWCKIKVALATALLDSIIVGNNANTMFHLQNAGDKGSASLFFVVPGDSVFAIYDRNSVDAGYLSMHYWWSRKQ